MGDGKKLHPIVLALAVALVALTVVVRYFYHPEWMVWAYVVLYPLLVGTFGRVLIAEADEAHLPGKDFPMWFYYLAWVLIGLMAYPTWARTLFITAIFAKVLWVYVAGVFVASFLNPWIPIRPAATFGENDDG